MDAWAEKSKQWSEEARQDGLSDMQALTEFVVSNTELEQLEERLRQFNLFEAIGMQRQEVKHSIFLAFLLDPQQTHGLGDDFLRKVLQRALLGADEAALQVSVVQLHLMGLNATTVEREWNNIDILLLDAQHELAVIIENKVLTSEHSNQLERYYQIVQREYPTWRLLGLYLTRYGAAPSDRRYLPISYAAIAEIIEALIASRQTALGPDIRTVMTHYAQMLRRNIVSDAELDALCLQIYHKHQRAIDLIMARVPNKRAIIQKALVTMVEQTPGIRRRWHSKNQISFHPEEWDVPALQYAGGKDAPALIFQFYMYNSPKYLQMWLEIREASVDRRTRLFKMAVDHGKPFNAQAGRLGERSSKVWSRMLVSARQMPQMKAADVITEAHKQWGVFLEKELPVIKKALEDQEWVWTTKTTDSSEIVEEQELNEEDDEQ